MPPPSRTEKQAIYISLQVFLATKRNNSFNKRVLIGHYGPGTFLSGRNTTVNKLHGFYVLSGEKQSQ